MSLTFTVLYTGCIKKSNPLGRILYLWNCRRFCPKFTDEDPGHISCKFC